MKPAPPSSSDARHAADVHSRGSPLQALIFDVDGTLADTEEAHRCGFNEAFRIHGLSWNWSSLAYSALLQVPGGKERIASYIRRLTLIHEETNRLLELVGQIHATKTTIYRSLVAAVRSARASEWAVS